MNAHSFPLASSLTARQLFLLMMAERRAFRRGSLDHDYRTRAARKYVWLMRAVPTTEWSE